MSNVLTIREAVKRAKSEGLDVSEYTLRRWVRFGVIPVRKAGTRNLIFYPNLVRFLQCDGGSDNPALLVTGSGTLRADLG